MRALLCVLILLAGCASPSIPKLFSTARAQTYLVATPSGHGTGVLLNDHCVLTAGHVADGNDEYVVVNESGTPVAAHKQALDDGVDLAVLCTDAAIPGNPVHLAKSMPADYSPVFTIGYPLNSSRVLTTGRYQMQGLITAPSAPGNSGGGVFNEDGEYIGMIDTISLYPSDRGMLVFPHLVGIIEVDTIRKFLDDNKIHYTS